MMLEEIARFADDMDGTVQFYQHLLGTPPAARTPGQTAIFQIGAVKLFLHQKMDQHELGWPLQDKDHISFAVESVDQACEELQRRGLHAAVGLGTSTGADRPISEIRTAGLWNCISCQDDRKRGNDILRQRN